MAPERDDGLGDLFEAPEPHLAELGERFMQAMDLLRRRRERRAAELLREILRREPRLAEPRLELGRLLLEQGDLEGAEIEAREALRLLEAGGQWLLDFPEEVLLSLAHSLLGEVLERRAEKDEAIYGSPEAFHELNREALAHFREAVRLDPGNEHARSSVFHLAMEEQELRDPELGGD